jgi:hypothetical protein
MDFSAAMKPLDFLSLTVPSYDKGNQRIVAIIRKHERAIAKLAKQGRFFTPVNRPKGFRLMAIKACYRNAIKLAVAGRAQYVEGYAMHDDGLEPVHHTWVTTDGINAIDVTWPKLGAVYFGVVFDTKALTRILLERNGWAEPMLVGFI